MSNAADPNATMTLPSAKPQMVKGADGVHIAAYEWGNPEGREILLVHGVAQSHLCFAPQIDSGLAREFRLVAIDLRGHGASAKPEGEAAYQREGVWAEDVAAVIQAKALRRPVAVGWSMGGRVLRQYLMHYGDTALAGINFVASRVIEDPRSVGPATPTKRPYQGLTLAQQIEEAVAFLDACYAKRPPQALFERALCYNMLVPLAVRKAAAGWHTDPVATTAALRQVRIPTLVTHGLKDLIALPQAARLTAEAIEHATVSWYDDCGHSPFQEDPRRFNRELADFARQAIA